MKTYFITAININTLATVKLKAVAEGLKALNNKALAKNLIICSVDYVIEEVK